MATLLTPDDVRGFSDAGLSDESLQLLLDAADAEIIRYAGPIDAAVEWLVGGRNVVALARPAVSITSIVEWNLWHTASVTLVANDYELDPSAYLIYRRSTGDNPRSWWNSGQVVVTYAPADEEAIRKGVELDLVKLMQTYQPGVTSETVGSWTTQLSGNANWNNDEERENILSRLVVHGRMVPV